MSHHLTDEQITASVAGLELGDEARRHLDCCLGCRSSVSEMRRLIEARRDLLVAGEPDWEAQRAGVLASLDGHAARRRRPGWLAPLLAGAGLLSPAYMPGFLLLLHHLDISHQALDLIKRDGLTRCDENKVERKHPALQIFRDNSAAARQWIAQFGMTPSSRSGLTVPEPEMPSLADVLFEMVKGKDE